MRANVGWLSHMTAVNQAMVELTGGRFGYLHTGPPDGRLVLCLHGFPDGPETFSALGVRLASAGYRVVAPWLRGYSPSVVGGSLDADSLAEDILELADVLANHGDFAVIGHDWGAVITWALLARNPQRLRCACVMSVAHPRTVAQHFLRAPVDLLRMRYAARLAMRSLGNPAWTSADMSYIDELWKRWSPSYQLPATEQQRLHESLRGSGVAPFAYYRTIGQLLKDLRTGTGWPAANRRTTVPVMYLHGAEDGCLPASSARGLSARLAGPFASEVLGGAGHFLPREAPEQIFTRVLRWLAMYMPATRAGPLA